MMNIKILYIEYLKMFIEMLIIIYLEFISKNIELYNIIYIEKLIIFRISNIK